jgi:hypothetical protein
MSACRTASISTAKRCSFLADRHARRPSFLPHLTDLVPTRKINPGKIFELKIRSPTWPKATVRSMNAERSRRC